MIMKQNSRLRQQLILVLPDQRRLPVPTIIKKTGGSDYLCTDAQTLPRYQKTCICREKTFLSKQL